MAGQARQRRRALPALALAMALTLLLLPFVQRARADASSACSGVHWVGGWRAAPQGSSLGRPDDADGPPRTFVDQTLRMSTSTRVEGTAVRVRLGNRHGPDPVVIDEVTLASRAGGPALVPGTSRALTFGGRRTVTIDPGREVVSDPLTVAVRPFQKLAVSFHVVGTGVLDHHQWATATSYATAADAGAHSTDEAGAAFTEPLTGWFGLAGIDVLTARRVGAVVTLGDSITDGVGSSPDADRRWPDALARRLKAARVPLSVVNAGIGGNHVVTSGLRSDRAVGASALERLERDALAVDGVTDLFLFEGINDLFKAESGDIVGDLVAAYEDIVERAHDADLRVTAATITPGALDGFREEARVAVNEWIRSTDVFDAVVDFDAVVRNPADPSRVRPEWDAGFAHLNDRGYARMAAAVPLGVFQGTGC